MFGGFDIFEGLLALTEVEWNGEKYLRLKTVSYHKDVESILVVKADSKLPANVVLIQVKKDEATTHQEKEEK